MGVTAWRRSARPPAATAPVACGQAGGDGKAVVACGGGGRAARLLQLLEGVGVEVVVLWRDEQRVVRDEAEPEFRHRAELAQLLHAPHGRSRHVEALRLHGGTERAHALSGGTGRSRLWKARGRGHLQQHREARGLLVPLE